MTGRRAVRVKTRSAPTLAPANPAYVGDPIPSFGLQFSDKLFCTRQLLNFNEPILFVQHYTPEKPIVSLL